MDWLIGV